MKNKVILIVLLLHAFIAFSQVIDTKVVLTSAKWKYDIEAMKPSILIKIGSVPQMKDLSDEEKELTVKSIIKTFEGIRYNFNNDLSFKMDIIGVDYKSSGNYILNKENNELILNSPEEPNALYKIVSVEEKRIVIQYMKTGLTIILIPDLL